MEEKAWKDPEDLERKKKETASEGADAPEELGTELERRAGEEKRSETEIEKPEAETGKPKTNRELEAETKKLESETELEKRENETEKSENDQKPAVEEVAKEETVGESEKKEPVKTAKSVQPSKKIDPRNMIIGMAVVVLSLVLIACIYFAQSVIGEISTKAIVEAPVVTLVSPVQGIVLEISVEEGDWVTSGSALAILDSEVQEKALVELQEQMEEEEAALAELLAGPDPEEVASAEESVENAQKAYDTAATSYETADTTYKASAASYDSAVANRDSLKALYEEGAAPEADYLNAEQTVAETLTLMQEAEKNRENAKKSYDMAKTRLEYAKDRLAEINAGPDPEEVKAAEDAIAETQAQIDQTKHEIELYTLRSDCDGVVTKINYKKGDIVAIGYKVFEITLQEEGYLSAFLSEGDLEKIELGQSVRIGDGQQEYEGIVMEIGEEPETVPAELESSVESNRDLYRVKIEVEKIGNLTSGETIGVVFPLHQKETDQ